MLKDAARSDPKVKELMPMIQQMRSGGNILMISFDLSKAGQAFVDNININAYELSQPTTYEKLLSASIDMIKPYLAKNTKSTGKIVTLPVGKAARLESTLSFSPPGNVSSIGYLIMKGRTQYTVTFSADSRRAAANRTFAERVMATFKWR